MRAVLFLGACCCALAAAAGGGCGKPTHNGTMFNQADIPNGHTTDCPSWQKCCALCLANLACNAYSWDGNNCYLKSGPNDPHPDVHTVSSVVRDVAPQKLMMCLEFQVPDEIAWRDDAGSATKRARVE